MLFFPAFSQEMAEDVLPPAERHVFPSNKLLRKICPGGHLLSRTVSGAVPSAGRVLTVVFGMGTGVAPGRIAARFFSCHYACFVSSFQALDN